MAQIALMQGAQTGVPWLDSLLQALARPDVGPGPAAMTGGRAFQNPALAKLFRRLMTQPTATGDVTGPGMMQAIKALMESGTVGQVGRLTERTKVNPATIGPNIANSVMGQTFGKGGVVPFSGAAARPIQSMAEPDLLAALLSSVIP